MTVLGNLSEPALAFNATSGTWGPPGALALAYLPCAVTSWNHVSITCTVPPGLDASVAVRVTAGGQAVVAAFHTGYAPPVVTGVVPLEALGTPGGGRVVVLGTGLPTAPWPLVVLVGGAECVASSRNGTAVTCIVPRGAGRAPVVVSTPRQTSVAVLGLSVLYASPELQEVVTPLGRSVDGGFPVVVRGRVSVSYCAPLSTPCASKRLGR